MHVYFFFVRLGLGTRRLSIGCIECATIDLINGQPQHLARSYLRTCSYLLRAYETAHRPLRQHQNCKPTVEAVNGSLEAIAVMVNGVTETCIL